MNISFLKSIFVQGTLLIGLLFATSELQASDFHIHIAGDHPADDTRVRFFTTYESNAASYISGVGTGLTLLESGSRLGFQLNTSLNNAEVLTTYGDMEEYFAWEGSIRFGVFSKISFYAEVGIDLTELLFHDLRYDNDGYHEYEDDIDSYFGIGAGFKAGPFKFEGFSRIRAIDSVNWQAEPEHFTGFQVSVNF